MINRQLDAEAALAILMTASGAKRTFADVPNSA